MSDTLERPKLTAGTTFPDPFLVFEPAKRIDFEIVVRAHEILKDRYMTDHEITSLSSLTLDHYAEMMADPNWKNPEAFYHSHPELFEGISRTI